VLGQYFPNTSKDHSALTFSGC